MNNGLLLSTSGLIYLYQAIFSIHFPIYPRVGLTYWYLNKKTLFYFFDFFFSWLFSPLQKTEVSLALFKDYNS